MHWSVGLYVYQPGKEPNSFFEECCTVMCMFSGQYALFLRNSPLVSVSSSHSLFKTPALDVRPVRNPFS